MAQRWSDPDVEADDRSWMDACVDRLMAGARASGSDGLLQEAVSICLARDRLLDAQEIAVEVEDGAVSLEGAVRSASDRSLAELLAHEVAGVGRVRNRLAVKPDLFGEAPAFRPFERRGVSSLGDADRAEAERHPTAVTLPPVIT